MNKKELVLVIRPQTEEKFFDFFIETAVGETKGGIGAVAGIPLEQMKFYIHAYGELSTQEVIDGSKEIILDAHPELANCKFDLFSAGRDKFPKTQIIQITKKAPKNEVNLLVGRRY